MMDDVGNEDVELLGVASACDERSQLEDSTPVETIRLGASRQAVSGELQPPRALYAAAKLLRSRQGEDKLASRYAQK